ncbi:MAG: alanine--tRNA ligase, partial [Candidatus Colwellbacteria bacterium]|nr:alanine--tRNA ligase [Candidatus Colwellbacteria bacterium]
SEFGAERAKHQEESRTASAGMFRGGLADQSAETTKLHTATHLLLAALRATLGEHVAQRGSNITGERLRFDFSHGSKLSDGEIERVEAWVNEKITRNLPVNCVELPLAEAEKTGALHVFGEKYPPVVKVHYIGNSIEDSVSKEFCGGPHVARTGELGAFKVRKEEAVSQGVRRIKATLG